MTPLLALVLSVAAAGLLAYFVYDTLKKDFASRLGQLQSHLNALQGRFKDHEAMTSKLALTIGQAIKEHDAKFVQIDEELDNRVDAQAIDSLSNEFFSLKSAVEALGQSLKKARKAKKTAKKGKKR